MPVSKTIRSSKTKTQSKFKKSAPENGAQKRDVILAPNLFEAVLESVEQAKAGQTVSHEEVKKRNAP